MTELNFSRELLARAALIQAAIDGVKAADAQFWNPDSKGPFPRFANRIQRIAKAPLQKGTGIRVRVFTVTMRLLAGPVAAGYKGANEDKLNALYDPVLDAFEVSPKLYHPDTNEALLHVERAEITDVTGTIGFTYSDATAPFFGTDFILQVTANFLVSRKV